MREKAQESIQARRREERGGGFLENPEEDRRFLEKNAARLCEELSQDIQETADLGKTCVLWNMQDHNGLLTSLGPLEKEAVINLAEQALRLRGFSVFFVPEKGRWISWGEENPGEKAEEARHCVSPCSKNSPRSYVVPYQRSESLRGPTSAFRSPALPSMK